MHTRKEKIAAIAKGELSPLAIQRQQPILQKPMVSTPLARSAARQYHPIFDSPARILGLETYLANEYSEITAYLRAGGNICIAAKDEAATKKMRRYYKIKKVGSQVQVFDDPELFFNPKYSDFLDATLSEKTVCVVTNRHAQNTYLKCLIHKTVLELWISHHHNTVLGTLAKTLLNVITSENSSRNYAIGNIRTAVQTFQAHETEIVAQMLKSEPELNPNWTYWHQLKHFFPHYTENVDAPMMWDAEEEALEFHIPPILHPKIKKLLLMAPILFENDIRQCFPNTSIEVLGMPQPPAPPGNEIYQIRTDLYMLGQATRLKSHIMPTIQKEVDKSPNIIHSIYGSYVMFNLRQKGRKNIFGNPQALRKSDILWVAGFPQIGPQHIWLRAQQLYGNEKKLLYYETDDDGQFLDERVQSVYENEAIYSILERVHGLKYTQTSNKKIVILTSFLIPGITDRPETKLFDWEDYEIAGGLENLAETITIRECYEADRDALSLTSSREEVEYIYGCTPTDANRILEKMRSDANRRTE